MNVQITKNNLLLIVKELEANKNPSEKSKAYLQFIKDGNKCIGILNSMIDDLQNTIAVNFKADLVSKIEEKQCFNRIKRLKESVSELTKENESLKKINEELKNQITI